MAVDRAAAQAWLDGYVAAWKSYDPEAIGALFADEVAYRYHPYDAPTLGRAAVVASWLGEPETAGGASTRDEPNTYDARYVPYAIDGDIVVATGTSVYRDHPDGPVARTFHNCFLIRFDLDGRCAEFTELYMEAPR